MIDVGHVYADVGSALHVNSPTSQGDSNAMQNPQVIIFRPAEMYSFEDFQVRPIYIVLQSIRNAFQFIFITCF